MSNKQPIDRIWELMSEIDIAMIVTHEGHDDAIRARPMAARPEMDDNAVYFFTDAEAPKDQEIAANSEVCLTFSDTGGKRFVSVTGTAEVADDPTIAAKVWTAADKAFWKDAHDPRLRVIRVTPQRGQYWEGNGLISSVVQMMKAAATGARPKLGQSEKVAM